MAMIGESEMRYALKMHLIQAYGSQKKAAQELECSDAYISAILTGRKAIPEHMLAMCGYERRTYYVKKGE